MKTRVHEVDYKGVGGNEILSKLGREDEKSYNSYKELIIDHQQKRKDYWEDPLAHDNDGRLAGAKNRTIQRKILVGRQVRLLVDINKQLLELQKLINKAIGSK